MSIEISKLLPIDKNETVFNSKTLYQQKIDLLLFAVIATRLDIAFAVLQLFQFNQQQKHQYQKAVD